MSLYQNDDLVFDDAEGLDNPLAVPLVAALRKVRQMHQAIAGYSDIVKAAIGLLHDRQAELDGVRRRNRALLDEMRVIRQAGRRAA